MILVCKQPLELTLVYSVLDRRCISYRSNIKSQLSLWRCEACRHQWLCWEMWVLWVQSVVLYRDFWWHHSHHWHRTGTSRSREWLNFCLALQKPHLEFCGQISARSLSWVDKGRQCASLSKMFSNCFSALNCDISWYSWVQLQW